MLWGPLKKNKINETEIVEVEGILLRPSPLEISGIITGIPWETCPNLSLPSPRLIASKSNVDLQREYSCQQISEFSEDVKLYRKFFDSISYFNHCLFLVTGIYISQYCFQLQICSYVRICNLNISKRINIIPHKQNLNLNPPPKKSSIPNLIYDREKSFDAKNGLNSFVCQVTVSGGKKRNFSYSRPLFNTCRLKTEKPEGRC